MDGKMDCHGLSDAGRKRSSNQDQFLIADLHKSMLIHQTSLSHEEHTQTLSSSQGTVMLVADGMGGEAAGEVASSLAVETVMRYLLNTMPWFFRVDHGHDADLNEGLKAALEACQRRVEESAQAGQRRMGTTLTMAYIFWPQLYVVHAGDSRCYLLRAGRLEQITTDHTIAQRLVAEGVLGPKEAEQSRWSHVLHKCIGGGTHDLNPDVYRATLEPGDRLLLCTDGLNRVVSDELIREELSRGDSAQQTCRRLIDLTNDGGGPDNVTVVVAYFLGSGEAVKHQSEEARVPDTAEFVPVTDADAEQCNEATAI